MKLSTVSLTTDTGGIVPSAREAMKIAEYKETPQEHIEVESAAPSLSKAKLTGGIVQLNLQANVDNWNLVEYPTGEELHF